MHCIKQKFQPKVVHFLVTNNTHWDQVWPGSCPDSIPLSIPHFPAYPYCPKHKVLKTIERAI